jgi:hypothetical protein
VLALAATGTLTTGARADDPTYEADVGGGAAGIMATVTLQSYLLRDLGQQDYTELSVVNPRVVMGDHGGNYAAKAVRQRVGPALVTADEVTVKGNRFGTPYAEATSKLADVSFVNGALKGTTALGAIETHCRWDRSGWVADTTITNVNGTKNTPAPNTVTEIPGLGKLTLNEQYVQSVPYLDAEGNYVRSPTYPNYPYYLYAETVYVIGAHLHLFSDVAPINGYTYDDIYLGFTSCDPFVLPNLSGLTRATTGD